MNAKTEVARMDERAARTTDTFAELRTEAPAQHLALVLAGSVRVITSEYVAPDTMMAWPKPPDPLTPHFNFDARQPLSVALATTTSRHALEGAPSWR